VGERRLRAGVVGVGHLGALHAAKYAASPRAELVAVHDLVPERAHEAAARHGCRAAATLDELLATVDVVSIAVPAQAHADVGRRAAGAGVHMLMEKPLAADTPSARAIADAARLAGVVLQVGHLERFNPVFQDVRRLVDRPRFVEVHRLSPYAGRGADTDVVFDVMIHDLDLLADLVGEPVVRVEAVGVAVLSRHVDIANARIRFAGGCIANVTASRVSLKRERKLRVFQEDAYVSVDFDQRSAVVARRKRAAAGEPGETADARSAEGADPMTSIEVEPLSFAAADPLAAEIDAFLACVTSGEPPAVGADVGLAALALADIVVGALEVPGPPP
jgi:predicted dehydrogenase